MNDISIEICYMFIAIITIISISIIYSVVLGCILNWVQCKESPIKTAKSLIEYIKHTFKNKEN